MPVISPQQAKTAKETLRLVQEWRGELSVQEFVTKFDPVSLRLKYELWKQLGKKSGPALLAGVATWKSLSVLLDAADKSRGGPILREKYSLPRSQNLLDYGTSNCFPKYFDFAKAPSSMRVGLFLDSMDANWIEKLMAFSIGQDFRRPQRNILPPRPSPAEKTSGPPAFAENQMKQENNDGQKNTGGASASDVDRARELFERLLRLKGPNVTEALDKLEESLPPRPPPHVVILRPITGKDWLEERLRKMSDEERSVLREWFPRLSRGRKIPENIRQQYNDIVRKHGLTGRNGQRIRLLEGATELGWFDDIGEPRKRVVRKSFASESSDTISQRKDGVPEKTPPAEVPAPTTMTHEEIKDVAPFFVRFARGEKISEMAPSMGLTGESLAKQFDRMKVALNVNSDHRLLVELIRQRIVTVDRKGPPPSITRKEKELLLKVCRLALPSDLVSILDETYGEAEQFRAFNFLREVYQQFFGNGPGLADNLLLKTILRAFETGVIRDEDLTREPPEKPAQ